MSPKLSKPFFDNLEVIQEGVQGKTFAQPKQNENNYKTTMNEKKAGLNLKPVMCEKLSTSESVQASAQSKASRNQEFDSPLKRVGKCSGYNSMLLQSASTQATRQTGDISPLIPATRATERKKLREAETKDLIAKTKI